jgi:plasmid maintenance system antidote protein VapI
MMTPLARFLTDAKISDADFAAKIGKHRSIVNKIRNGRLKPTLDVAADIETHTGGAVPMQAWTDLAVSMCGTCERRAEDPSITSCTRTDCGVRHREAA